VEAATNHGAGHRAEAQARDCAALFRRLAETIDKLVGVTAYPEKVSEKAASDTVNGATAIAEPLTVSPAARAWLYAKRGAALRD